MVKVQFEHVYNADGICTNWHCGKPGVILALDSFSPEVAYWFCESCWGDDEAIIYTIVEDKRKRPNDGPPPIAQSTVSGIQPDFTAVSGQASILAGPRQLDERCPYDTTYGTASYTSLNASGSFTCDDLMQFADELKREGCEPYREILTPDEWRMRSREASNLIELPREDDGWNEHLMCYRGLIGTPWRCVIPHTVIYTETTTEPSTNSTSWAITQRMVNRIRYLNHLGWLHRLPHRKLKKCHMRKIYAQRKQLRRKYGL